MPGGIGLSIRQPWIDLILAGRKTIEVRTWKTHHRGPLWLHAGKCVDTQACDAHALSPSRLITGAIVGAVDLENCFEFDLDKWTSLLPQHLNIVPFDKRYFGWTLRDPIRIAPIPYRGALGLMKISPEALTGCRND